MRVKEVPAVARSQPKTSLKRETLSDRRGNTSDGQGVQELRSVNIALAEQLAQERAEHEKDVTEANATIKQLHDALSQMRDQLEATTNEQNQRVQGVATSLRGLQTQLRLQEETKASSEVRAQELSECVRVLGKQAESLRLHVQERDAQLTALRSDYDDVCKGITDAKQSEEAACARVAALEQELVQGRSKLSSSDALISQLKESVTDVQRELEQLTLKEQKAVEDLVAAQEAYAKRSAESEEMSHRLNNERGLHAKSQEDLKGLQAENKDLISQIASARASVCTVEELKCQCSKLQAERDTMDACIIARAQELESLTAENIRLKSDWKLREDGLSSSHAIRIQHLMKSLQEREQQNCDLHNSLHRAKVRIETFEAELETKRQQSEKASEAILSLEQSCADLSRRLEEERNKSTKLLTDAAEAKRVQDSKIVQRDADLEMSQRSCHDLQARVESLLLQMQNQMTAHASLKQQLQDSQQANTEQVSKLTASIREVSQKLLECQRQHDHAMGTADSTIQQLTNKMNAAISESAAVKAALETAVLENEASQNEITSLQKDLEDRAGDLSMVKSKLEHRNAESEGLKSAFRQKQSELESVTQRHEKMLKAVTNALNVEEHAKLSAQKQLRLAKDRASQLDQELTDMMGKLADSNERARDMQAERDDAMDTVQALRRKLDFQRRREQAEQKPSLQRPYDSWLRKSSKALGFQDSKYSRHSTAGELYDTSNTPIADEMSSYQQRLAEIRGRE